MSANYEDQAEEEQCELEASLLEEMGLEASPDSIEDLRDYRSYQGEDRRPDADEGGVTAFAESCERRLDAAMSRLDNRESNSRAKIPGLPVWKLSGYTFHRFGAGASATRCVSCNGVRLHGRTFRECIEGSDPCHLHALTSKLLIDERG